MTCEISILACVCVSPSGHNPQRSPFCVHQSIPFQTYQNLRSSTMHSGLSDSSIFWISRSSWNFWILDLDLLTYQFLNDIYSCIGPMIINDPAQIPEHAILTINAICTDTFRFTIICVHFTCSRFCTRLSSALSSSTSSRIGSCALDWNQYFTILIIQSLCCQFFDIFALSF